MPNKLRYHRLTELWTDPASQELSASRLCLILINLAGVAAAIKLLMMGKDPTLLLTGLAATDAGVYAVSTHKSTPEG